MKEPMRAVLKWLRVVASEDNALKDVLVKGTHRYWRALARDNAKHELATDILAAMDGAKP